MAQRLVHGGADFVHEAGDEFGAFAQHPAAAGEAADAALALVFGLPFGDGAPGLEMLRQAEEVVAFAGDEALHHEAVAGMAALASRYGITDGIICVPLNISLYDDRTGLPLRRLSGRKVDMELPIPTELTMQENIMVAALDDNGMLNEISSEIVNHGGNDKVRFVASHFSTYIFYSGIRQEEILSEESMAANTQSVVIRTLNRNVGIMSVKWYIAVILLSMAAILILYKGKSRT